MPLRSYHASKNPPTALDHTLAHEYEVGLAVFQGLGGLFGLMALVLPRFSVSQSLDRMPTQLAAVLCALLLAAAVWTLAGVYSGHEDLMVGYRRERTGLILSATAWLIYGIVVAFVFPASVFGWAIGPILATCAGLRLWATYREERRLRFPPVKPEGA